MIAFVCPGQGSQVCGMGRDFYDKYPVAQNIFDNVDSSLQPLIGQKLSDIIFGSDEDLLKQTEFTQPALMVTSVAIAKVLEERLGKKATDIFNICAGHSLGEYSALCIAGGIDLADCAKALYNRGIFMKNSAEGQSGGMCAILGMSFEEITNVIEGYEVSIANDNCPGQIVVSGKLEHVQEIQLSLKSQRKKAILLPVSGAFHSPMMKKAMEDMDKYLSGVQILDTQIDLISNFTAEPTKDGSTIKSNLVKQVNGCVKWTDTMKKMTNMGVTKIVEIGSKKVLSGLAKKSFEGEIVSIETTDELEAFCEQYSAQ